MSLFVLDTDILTLYQLGQETVCRHVGNHSPMDLAVTIISVEEQLSSWFTLIRKTKKRDERARAYQRFTDNVRFLSRLQIITFTEAAMEKFEKLKARKLGVKPNDLRIAAIAIDQGAVVITRNVRDFNRVPGVRVEDWST